MGLPLTTDEKLIGEDKTVIRKSNDAIVMTIRKKLKYLTHIQKCLQNHSVLTMKYVEEDGRPFLKVELEPKQNEQKR